jgi:O-methyltransferase involved in polyketide biosynthesis
VQAEKHSRKRHKVSLKGAQETLMWTLRAKARDARASRPILGDTLAAEWADAVAYDFDGLIGIGDGMITLRARQLDAWIEAFLETHPQATVLQLGCGLDTRYFRLRRRGVLGPGVLWFDVDYPEVMTLRHKFCGEEPGYRMLAASVTDPDLFGDLPADRRENVPVLVIAEGLFEYLEPAEVQALLNRLTKRFGSGEIVFDVLNSFAVKAARGSLRETTGAKHLWAVDDPGQVDRMDPRLKRRDALPLFASRFVKSAAFFDRMLYALANRIPPFRTLMRLMRYDF